MEKLMPIECSGRNRPKIRFEIAGSQLDKQVAGNLSNSSCNERRTGKQALVGKPFGLSWSVSMHCASFLRNSKLPSWLMERKSQHHDINQSSNSSIIIRLVQDKPFPSSCSNSSIRT
jgi:hypothetical protein